MQITRDEAFGDWIIKKIEEREFKERTGTHQSDICYCLNKQALRRLFPQEPNRKELLLYSIGWATQAWLTGHLEDVEPKVVDGITVTLDALHCPKCGSITNVGTTCSSCGGQLYPFELKASYQSSNRAVEENGAWIRQILSQCHVMDVTTAYLSRFEIMGNWKIKEGDRPTLSAWKLDFTQEEIDHNWEWLRERKDVFEEILETRVLVPKIVAIPSGQVFECAWCNYKGGECDQ